MKRFRLLFLSIVLILSACSNSQESQTNEQEIVDSKEAETSKSEKNEDKNTSSMTVVDLDGNEISIEKPLEKVIIQGSSSGGPFMTMIYLDNDNFLGKIAAMDDSVRADRNDFYTRLAEKMPEIDDVPRIANFKDNDFSYEAILKADADGIIAPIGFKSQIEAIKSKIDIPVFYVDYHSQDFDKHIASTKLISKLTGLDKNLDELIDFYTTKVGPIIEKDFDEDKKPLVYLEHGYEGEKDYGNSYGSDMMWGKIIEEAGGHNIGSDVLKANEALPLSSEYVLSANPEIIFFTGSQWVEKPHSMKMGYDTTKDQVKEKIDLYQTRPGWSELDAYKDKNIHVISQQLVRDMSDFFSYEYIAKTLHPQEYEDLDPFSDFKEFYDKFMPIDLEGTWAYEYKEE